jgi:hypothetical protein
MKPLHQFHIPVMGLAYTIDSPIKVAQYGIASTISIIEDRLIELMRAHYYKERNEKYIPITTEHEDCRAKRITDYLNLVNRIVGEQVARIKNSAFEAGSEISKYFEMLPSDHVLRQLYKRMLEDDTHDRKVMETYLRGKVVPGAIDVNIMTKVDKDNRLKNGDVLPDASDALAALRGYAESDLNNSSMIFSAGMNPRLFAYLEKCKGFDANEAGVFAKKIVIKVSDFRSALIQGKFLAKKGLWVSEYRIESGLNCGGHAFASDGNLLGPILEEFKTRRDELSETLFQLYRPAAETKTGIAFSTPHPIMITVQGGIGTFQEAEFLLDHYKVHSTGWGTPFLLCPEATTVDQDTLDLLVKAKESDVILSKNSPLGVRFNYLKGTSAEEERLDRIRKGRPGSPCTEKHLISNTEFTKEPICTASRQYQEHKIAQLVSQNLSEAEYKKRYEDVVSKECLCVGLINSAITYYHLPPIKRLTAVTICPGPNIAYFNRIVTLKEMTDHIYGRSNVLGEGVRPHMFIKELGLNVTYVQEKIGDMGNDPRLLKDVMDFIKQLFLGIEYYRTITDKIRYAGSIDADLDRLERDVKNMAATVTAFKDSSLKQEHV